MVVSRNFNDLTWLTDDGAFHSNALMVTEKLTRRGNEIEWPAAGRRSEGAGGALAAAAAPA